MLWIRTQCLGRLGARLLLFVFIMSGCHTVQLLDPDDLGPVFVPPEEEYVIGPEDILEINVWKNPDLSKSVVVRPDGAITLALIGEVSAGGTTPNRVREEIRDRLSGYYKEIPEVTVSVFQVNSYDIYVLGEVRNPGKYQVQSHTSVLQAVALGGGFTEWARKNKMIILRRGQDGQDIRISIRYKDILNSKTPDLFLQREDRLIVP